MYGATQLADPSTIAGDMARPSAGQRPTVTAPPLMPIGCTRLDAVVDQPVERAKLPELMTDRPGLLQPSTHPAAWAATSDSPGRSGKPTAAGALAASRFTYGPAGARCEPCPLMPTSGASQKVAASLSLGGDVVKRFLVSED